MGEGEKADWRGHNFSINFSNSMIAKVNTQNQWGKKGKQIYEWVAKEGAQKVIFSQTVDVSEQNAKNHKYCVKRIQCNKGEPTF